MSAICIMNYSRDYPKELEAEAKVACVFKCSKDTEEASDGS